MIIFLMIILRTIFGLNYYYLHFIGNESETQSIQRKVESGTACKFLILDFFVFLHKGLSVRRI